MKPKRSKTMISHGSRETGIRLTVRDDYVWVKEASTLLTPTETAELAHGLLIALFQTGYDINARRRS